MRRFFYIAPLVVMAIASCGNAGREFSAEEQTPQSLDGKGLAVEIIADYNLETYERPIDRTSDFAFIDSQVSSAMQASTLYADEDGTDTWTESSQIPFCARISETTSIYCDGTSKYEQITDLNPDSNPLLGLHDTELDLSYVIARISIKDGVSTTYNRYGEVLATNEVEMPDYSGLLAELKDAQAYSEIETKSGIKHDINWLRAQMASQYQTKAGGEPSYSIYEAEGGKVILEQNIGLTKAGEELTIKTIYSPDIELNYGYEQLVDGKLQVKCTHSFDSSVPSNEVSKNNPVRTIQEELSYRTDGTPVIKVSEKEFMVNKVRYNLN